MVENLASAGRRVLGAIVDIILLIIIMLAFGKFFGETKGFSISVKGLPAVVMFLIWFLYFTVMEATMGKTLGKYVAKTNVVNESGSKISWGQSLGRNLMRFIDGLLLYLVGFITLLASKNKQRLGDMVSKTYVING